MSSLVPDYGDSDSNSDENLEQEQKDTTDSSNSEDEDKYNNGNVSITSINDNTAQTGKLPVPGFLALATTNKKTRDDAVKQASNMPSTSVFSNPFVEAENAKQSTLEKHVKMVDGAAATTINGKKVCWNYRKGRCRFGHNCKYAHDSDLQKTKAQIVEEKHLQEAVVSQQTRVNSIAKPPRDRNMRHREQRHTKGGNECALVDDDDNANGLNQAQKRKRPGLSQSLQPGKKVLKDYYRLKH